MRIAVVGSGYVGLVAGACFADLGHDVILVDNDQRKLAALRNGQVPIHEKFLPGIVEPPSRQPPDVFRRSARSRAPKFGHLCGRGHTADRKRRSRLVLRGIRGTRNFRRHRRIQSRRRKKHRSGLHQRMGAQDYPAQRHRSGVYSTSHRILNSCAKAPRSPIFSFPIAS